MFCLTGVVFGTAIGYYIGVNRRFISHHIHHIKAIACHHYYGIEVHNIIHNMLSYPAKFDNVEIYFLLFVCRTQGVFIVEDAEMPTIRKSNEVLIQVKAASLNVIDTKICSGYSRIYRKLLNSGVSEVFFLEYVYAYRALKKKPGW